jgi:hypothetical protein
MNEAFLTAGAPQAKGGTASVCSSKGEIQFILLMIKFGYDGV